MPSISTFQAYYIYLKLSPPSLSYFTSIPFFSRNTYFLLLSLLYLSRLVLFVWISTIKMQAVKGGEGRQYSLADDKGPSQLLLRAKKGVFTTPAYVQELEKAQQLFGTASYLLQTRDGELIIAASESRLVIVHLAKGVLMEEAFNYLYSVTLSPNQKYLQLLDKVDANQGKTVIISPTTFKPTAIFKENASSNYYVKSSYPLVRFSSDDKLLFRYNAKTIQVLTPEGELKRIIKSGLQQSIQISLTSTAQNYLIAAAFLDSKSNKGNLLLFTHDKDEPIYEKNINKAEEVRIKFSPVTNSFLIELQTYFDPTGKSYYGQYGLYLYNHLNNKITKVKTAQGPLHDFEWDRKGQHYLVISGFMPAQPVLFTKDNVVAFEFEKQHKNQVIWGNLGRFVCLAGFGNLNGEMEIWDMQTRQRVGVCKSNSASHCEWSPDDRKLLTAILTPRLRVDNCYKVFSYTGVLLHKANYDHTELYEAVWLKSNAFTEKDARGLSPGRKSGGEVKPQPKFKSFGASLNFDPMSNHYAAKVETGPKLVPGQHPEDPPKKKKKRKHYEPKLEA